LSDVIPSGADKVEPLTDVDYDFALKFPLKTTEYDSGVKATYRTKAPTGKIYAIRFKSVSGAEEFFSAILDKIGRSEEVATKSTLTVGGESLDVYHKTKYKEYFGALMRKGVFIYYVAMGSNEYEVETYIRENMGYLFVPDIVEAPPPTAPPTLEVDLTSPSTSLADVIPPGAEVETLSDTDCNYVLSLPPKTFEFDTGIKAVYEIPRGTIYVLRFRSVSGAEEFFSSILGKIERGEDLAVKRTLTIDGKSLVVYHRVKYKNFYGTFAHRGVFIYYVDIGADQYEAEAYIKKNMGYLFV
jgi:glutaredoxin